MQTTLLVLSLWAIICCQQVVPAFNRCDNGDNCIDIRVCHLFGPHHTQPSKWTTSQTKGFQSRLCAREETADEIIHKVCCPKSPSTPLSGNGSRKGLDLLDLDGCGPYASERFLPSSRKEKLFKYPWMAQLFSEGQFICGGTLINNRYVLTAAICVKNIELDFVRLGEYDLNRTIDCDRKGCAPVPQDIPIELKIIHEDYSFRRKEHNIALLRLTHEATMNDNVVPICLPVVPAMKTNLPTYLMTGWGATETNTYSKKLKVIKHTLISNDECQMELRALDRYATLFDTQMCAIGAGVCIGDAGGPLKTVSVGGRFVQYGVISYGIKDCKQTNKTPSVYTKVESYVDWILDKLEN